MSRLGAKIVAVSTGADVFAARIATGTALILALAPQVPLLLQALIAGLVVLLLLGPLVAGVELLGRLLGRLGGRERARARGRVTENVPSIAISFFLAALTVGGAVYIIGEQASQRQIAEAQLKAEEERSTLEAQQRAKAQKQEREKRSFQNRLLSSRLATQQVKVSAFVRRARQERRLWKSTLLGKFGPCWQTKKILHQLKVDVGNIATARDRLASPQGSQSLIREIRHWIKQSIRNRAKVRRGIPEYRPIRFVLKAA
ncbi:MAG TPA: hypothetical protein VFT19_00775 [Solirubrobacterales bacterium]|nr:hypothetical protein [Solirubrobacterales bacterium]